MVSSRTDRFTGNMQRRRPFNRVLGAGLAGALVLLSACSGPADPASTESATNGTRQSAATAAALTSERTSVDANFTVSTLKSEPDDSGAATATPAPDTTDTTDTTNATQSPEPAATSPGAALADLPTTGLAPLNVTGESAIRVDQFGYLPSAPKIAVIVDPQWGFNADDEYTPGAELEVRSSSGEVVFTGEPVLWNDGNPDAQAGDRGWWFDFSEVTTPGAYEIVDPTTNTASVRFAISPTVYDDVLDAAMRVFWFNRANVEHPESLAGQWGTPAAVVQDREALSIDDPSLAARDLSGGWFDAGDTNKYVTFAVTPVHQLLGAWETTPDIFDDASGIPESGNGTPDILDEVRVELEWLRKMQLDDGAVLTKVGFSGWDGAPSIFEDTRQRFYEEPCSSAAIAASGMFAHGSLAFADIDPWFADDLAGRALRAWDWYQANPRREDCDPQVINAGDADLNLRQQEQLEFVAAVYLFAATGEDRFNQVVAGRVTQTRPFDEQGFGRYSPEQAEAIEYYLALPNAASSVASQVEPFLVNAPNSIEIHGFDATRSLYRSWMPDAQYHWGSNMVMANTGNANLALARLGENHPDWWGDETDAALRERAAAHINTLHGVNPLGIAYLSNMELYGAEKSIDQLYHFWFRDGSAFDSASDSIGPAPGYLVGGPNANYSGSASPPQGQPASKAYLDWNASDEPSRAWEISEPAIYYQSSYVRLLSAFIDAHS